jgi:alpha-1,3-mannosyltransferase
MRLSTSHSQQRLLAQFLPEDVFVAKPLSILLLLLHLSGLAYFCRNWLAAWRDECNKQQQQPSTSPTRRQLSPVYIVATLLVSNYVGICFARTLHYQFYAWYFHSLPFLLWYGGLSATRPSSSYPVLLRLVILLAIEWAFLTFPATPTSSAMLQVAQLAILVQIRPPNPFVDVAASAMPSLPKKKD